MPGLRNRHVCKGTLESMSKARRPHCDREASRSPRRRRDPPPRNTPRRYAEVFTEREAARLLVYNAARLKEAGKPINNLHPLPMSKVKGCAQDRAAQLIRDFPKFG